MKQFKNMDKGALTAIDMKSSKYKALYAVMCLIMLLYCIVIFVPTLWLLVAGFKDAQEMYAIPSTFFPKEIRISKLIKAWTEMKFYNYYANTFLLAGGCVAFELVISGFAGYALSKIKPKGSGFVQKVFFALMLLPGIGSVVPVYMIIKSLGLMNTYLGLWIMGGVNVFHLFLFKNFFDGISNSLVEAARIDGASNLHIFFRIMLPLSVPIFIVVAVFAFNAQMGTFLWPYLLIQDTTKTVLGVVIYQMRTNSNWSMDYQMLSILFSIVPQIIIFAIFQKQIIGGVNVGGVKG